MDILSWFLWHLYSITPDLQLAKIYLSVFNTENKQEPLLEMEENMPRLKQSLYARIKKQMRVMPEIKFFWTIRLVNV